jgi:hypothetical protein
MKMGTRDPGSLFSYEIRAPRPQFHNILGTLGSPFSYEIRDPSMKMGTPMQFIFSLPPFAILMLASCYYEMIIYKDDISTYY